MSNLKNKHLFLQLLSKLLGFALLVIVHDHHGSIDLTYGHVTGCKGEGRKQWDIIHLYQNGNYFTEITPAMARRVMQYFFLLVSHDVDFTFVNWNQ